MQDRYEGIRLLLLLGVLVFLCGLPVVAVGQQLTPAMLEQASRQSGLSQEELMRRYLARGGTKATADTLQAPGRAEVPPSDNAVVILPFDLEPADFLSSI